jgi:hypothetical protein
MNVRAKIQHQCLLDDPSETTKKKNFRIASNQSISELETRELIS